MRRIIYGLVFIVFLVIGSVAALPLLLSSDKVWAEISPVLEKQTGRKISVLGDRKLTLYPNIALILGDVKIGSSIADSNLVTLKELRVSVNLMSLFGGNIAITELEVNNADINLILNKDGIGNWQTAQNPTNDDPLGALIENTLNEETAPNSQPATEFDLKSLSIKNFKIKNSRIVYSDLQSGTEQKLENINLEINLSEKNKNLSINGNVDWQKQKINLALKDFEFANFISNQKSELNLKVKSSLISTQVNAMLSGGENFVLDGKINLNTNSIQQLTQWLNVDLSDIHDSAIGFNSNIKVTNDIIQLSNYNLTAFDAKVNGTLNVGTKDILNIYGKMNVDNLDYNRIIITNNENSEEWSNKPIKLDILAQLNSNIELVIGTAKYKNVTANNLAAQLVIRDSKANIPFKLSAFDGTISGNVSASLGKTTNHIGAKIIAQNIKAGNALKDLDITDKLSGTTNFNSEISSSGNSTRQFINNLKGHGNVEMLNGIIEGIAIADALAPEIANIDLSLNNPEKLIEFGLQAGKNITTKMSSNFNNSTGDAQQTKFVKATMSYVINKGQLDNTDLQINSESIVIRGAGNVDLANKSLNYRIIPNVVRKNEQGSTERMTIPVLITGKWNNPKIEVDYAYAIDNSSTISNIRKKAVEKITNKITKKVGDKVINKVKQAVGDELGKVIGDELNKNITDQIGNLFGLAPQEKTEAVSE